MVQHESYLLTSGAGSGNIYDMINADKLIDIGFAVMIPTVVFTSDHPNKSVRVLGFLAAFPLFPLMFFGVPIIALGLFVGIFEDI